jgi:hypothetical protein
VINVEPRSNHQLAPPTAAIEPARAADPMAKSAAASMFKTAQPAAVTMQARSKSTFGVSPTRSAAIGSKDHPNQYLRKGAYENYYERRLDEENQAHMQTEKVLVNKLMSKGILDQMHGAGKLGKSVGEADLRNLTIQQKQALMHASTGKDQWDSLPAKGAKTAVKPSTGPIPPMKEQPKKGDQLQERPYEFVFKSHFDEGGALYFLGSYGGKRLYQNPHTIG